FLFIAPVATGPMLAALVINSVEIVWIFTVFLSFVVSAMYDLNVMVLVVTVVAGITAAKTIFAFKSRNDIYRAGLQTGLVKAFTIVLVYSIANIRSETLWYDLFWAAGA